MGAKILTVDDSKTIRLIIGRAFKPFDCHVLEASNGVEGLAVATRDKPDVIILDYTMPVMDGGEMLGRLRSNPELKSVPVIMLTSEAGRDTVLKIAKLGVRDYLIKPFKEELIVEKIGRVVDLRPKGEGAAKVKRYDDPLNILVVDDKPVIHEQIKAGLADTPWKIEGCRQAGQAVDMCSVGSPDAIIVSVSLPEDSAFTLVQMLKASVKTKNTPIFAMCVKTATDEQLRAQQFGFTGFITKPIDFQEMKVKIARALNLDTSYRYFAQKEDVLLMSLPADFTPQTANEVSLHLRAKMIEAVDAGLDKMVIDLSQVQTRDVSLIKLLLSVLSLCHELSIKYSAIGSEAVLRECQQYEETKDWKFLNSLEEALASVRGKALVA